MLDIIARGAIEQDLCRKEDEHPAEKVPPAWTKSQPLKHLHEKSPRN
jgi:hypothetical protein